MWMWHYCTLFCRSRKTDCSPVKFQRPVASNAVVRRKSKYLHKAHLPLTILSPTGELSTWDCNSLGTLHHQQDGVRGKLLSLRVPASASIFGAQKGRLTLILLALRFSFTSIWLKSRYESYYAFYPWLHVITRSPHIPASPHLSYFNPHK